MTVEADFTREYRLDLAKELPRMTWRRFQTLIRGLSSDSATIVALRAADSRDGRDEVIVLETEEQVMAARSAIFGKPPAARA